MNDYNTTLGEPWEYMNSWSFTDNYESITSAVSSPKADWWSTNGRRLIKWLRNNRETYRRAKGVK